MPEVLLRQARSEDAPRLLQIYAPYVTDSNISFELEAPSEEEFIRRVETIGARYPYLVCELDGEIAGYAYASRYREREGYRFSVGVSVYVDSEHHGKHIGKALYSALLNLLARQGYYKAYADITGANPGSVAMHSKMGFTHTATFRNIGYKRGVWLDVISMEYTLREPAPEPQPTKTIAQLDGEAVRAALKSCERMIADSCR